VTPGGAVLRASQPRIELRDEQLLAVYSIAWTGAVDTLSISGEDRYGNHSP
jgi:hypothetical protein